MYYTCPNCGSNWIIKRPIGKYDKCPGCDPPRPFEKKSVKPKPKKSKKLYVHGKTKRKIVFERDGHKCVVPGCTNKDLTIDHIIPRSKGGSNEIDNLQTMCGDHNSKKSNKMIDITSKEYIAERLKRLEHKQTLHRNG